MKELFLIDEVRTNNFSDDRLSEKIEDIWSKADKRIGDRDIVKYGIYFLYENNYKGDYNLAIGTEELETNAAVIVGEDYVVLKVDNKEEDGVAKAWQQIWDMEERGQIDRAYLIDYEKHYPNGDVDLHISVK